LNKYAVVPCELKHYVRQYRGNGKPAECWCCGWPAVCPRINKWSVKLWQWHWRCEFNNILVV